jgi:hypothetical protein
MTKTAFSAGGDGGKRLSEVSGGRFAIRSLARCHVVLGFFLAIFAHELAFRLSGNSVVRIGKRKTPQGERGLSFGVSR